MINNLKKGYDCASTLKDILERKQIIDNYHLTGYLDRDQAIKKIVELRQTDAEVATVTSARLVVSSMPFSSVSNQGIIAELQMQIDIMGKSGLGKDGVFPHEDVRIAMEKYSNDDLTHNVAYGWLNSRGARYVQDGLSEIKMELQYREYARKMELDFPQTAKVLLIIADDYHWEAKHDQLDSELFPQ